MPEISSPGDAIVRDARPVDGGWSLRGHKRWKGLPSSRGEKVTSTSVGEGSRLPDQVKTTFLPGSTDLNSPLV